MIGLKKIVTHAVAASTRIKFKGHIFKFDNKIYAQMEGEAVGVNIAGNVAILFMAWLNDLKRI